MKKIVMTGGGTAGQVTQNIDLMTAIKKAGHINTLLSPNYL